MKKIDILLAEKLLEISAIKLQPDSPFVWSSGWNSPIYTDNRKTLSYPDLRSFIKVELSRLIMEHFGDVEAIAGVATGAIAQGALVADTLHRPFVYVRSTPKDHGLENLIEGNIMPGQKVVIVEDLVSTGQSSLKAAQAVRDAGGEVIGMVAIFNYQFDVAEKAFADAGVKLVAISNYTTLIEAAVAANAIKESDVEALKQWREDPANWAPSGRQQML